MGKQTLKESTRYRELRENCVLAPIEVTVDSDPGANLITGVVYAKNSAMVHGIVTRLRQYKIIRFTRTRKQKRW